jgi:hypothetical protein
LPLSDNPHPGAGKPDYFIKVGVQKECIPCTVLSRHEWANRAMKAERELRELKAASDRPSDSLCRFPLCQTEAEQQRIADEVYAELYSGEKPDRSSVAIKRYNFYVTAESRNEPIVPIIEIKENGEWVKFEDVAHLLTSDHPSNTKEPK